MTYIQSLPAQIPTEKPASWPARNDLPLVEAVAKGTELQNEIYLRYRRPLLQILIQRRIPSDAIEDLLQRTFEQAIKKIRSGAGLEDPTNLGGYLYGTLRHLVTSYWRGELTRQHDGDSSRISNLADDTLSLEERVDHAQLAECVRKLLRELPKERDREVLERYYLHEEPRTAIRKSLRLTELQFNNVLWRARQRFGEMLVQHGLVAKSSNSATT
jgi:RNA polymerase sigma factor (sigma-70 family)